MPPLGDITRSVGDIAAGGEVESLLVRSVVPWADERVRRTLRVTVQVDQHLHALASLLGLDLNGALSVAIVEHHLYLLHRRTPTEG